MHRNPWIWAIAVGLVMQGCDAGSAEPVAVAQVPTVHVFPPSAALGPRGSQLFTASVTGLASGVVTWRVTEASGGAVTFLGGLYSAPASPGTYHVTATAFDSVTKGTAVVTVATQTPAVQVVPASITLAPSGTQTFTATVTGLTDTSVTWSVLEGAGGTIGPTTGQYTAPATPGTYHVDAKASDGVTHGQAVVTVQAVQACAQNASSIVWTVPPQSNIFNWHNYGNYVVAFDNWNTISATMWSNSATCWGFTAPGVTSEGGGIAFAPAATRGWIYNMDAMNNLSDAGTQNWTTKSGLGIQLSALTKAKAHWSVSTPTAPYPASRWNCLLDVFLHTMREPTQANGWLPYVDLQIIPWQMDSGFYAAILSGNHGFNITLGGEKYSVVIDVMGPFNQPGGHTITMFSRPNDWADSGTGFLWGKASQTHDLKAIFDYFLQSNPKDDLGNAIKSGNGTVVTTPLFNPAWYFTSANFDFEIDYAKSGSPPWVTNNLWLAVQNEPDGSSSP